MYTYNAIVERVIDGDTMVIRVDVGFYITIKHVFRVHNFNAPETRKPAGLRERKHGIEAKKQAVQLLEGKAVQVMTYKMAVYNRYEADIIIDGADFASIMKDLGYTKKAKY